MSRVRNVVQRRKPKPEFADLWDALIEQHAQDLDAIPKTINVPVPPSGNGIQYLERLKPALEARFEQIDARMNSGFLALAQAWENREEDYPLFQCPEPLAACWVKIKINAMMNTMSAAEAE